MKKRVALIFGGEGSEREISKLSAENLVGLIDKSACDVVCVEISENAEWYILGDTLSCKRKTPTFPIKIGEKSGFLCGSEILSVDLAIPCLHGDFGEDGVVQGALAAAHIKYVGQDVYASAVTSDKAYTRAIADALSIPGAMWILLTEENPEKARALAEEKIAYPMFIKPTRQGSSFGSHPVYSKSDFKAAYLDAKRYGKRVLIEELVDYEFELECALFLDRFSAGGRILSGGDFYDYKSKYDKSASPKTEAKSGKFPIAEELAKEYSKKLSDFIGIKELSRFDFFVTADEKVYFNEINVFPGMTKTSLYPELTEDIGICRGEFLNTLIAEALKDDRRL